MKMFLLGLLLLAGTADAAKIQKQGIKTEAECIAAGATAATCLPTDSQIFVTATSLNKTLDDAITDGDIGGGGGGVNFITNGGYDSAITGTSAYADAAGSSPVDATGGAPTVTCTRTTSSPLRKAGSLLITKDAANRQGEGCSIAFTADVGEQGHTQTVEFMYSPASGTYSGGTSSTNSDLTVYAVDVTNGTVIQPDAFKLDGAVNGQFYKGLAVFQLPSNSVSYRLAFHVATTSASAYTMKIDEVKVGPSNKGRGPPVTDWVDFTPTGNFTTNTTYSGKWRRVGDTMEIQYRLDFAGAPNATTNFLNMPSGYSIDTSKLTNTSEPKWQGVGAFFDASGNTTALYAEILSAGFITRYGDDAAGFVQNRVSLDNLNPFTIASGDRLTITVSVPIAGWSSGQTMSSSDGGRDVYLTAGKTSGNHSSSGSEQTVASWDTATLDSHSAFVASTGIWTAPDANIYDIFVEIGFAANSTGSRYCGIAKNGTSITKGTGELLGSAVVATYLITMDQFRLNGGDTIRIVCYQNSGGNLNYAGSTSTTRLVIKKHTGGQQILASEKISFRGTAGTQAVTGAVTNLAFTTVTDSHGTWNGTTYPAPAAGDYLVTLKCADNAGATNGFDVYIDGTIYDRVLTTTATSSGTAGPGATLVTGVRAGQAISIRSNSTVTAAAGTLTIHRIGN